VLDLGIYLVRLPFQIDKGSWKQRRDDRKRDSAHRTEASNNGWWNVKFIAVSKPDRPITPSGDEWRP